MPSIRPRSLKAMAVQLTGAGAIDREGVNQLLDRALSNNKLSSNEHRLLSRLAGTDATRFDADQTRARLQAFLDMPDDHLREVAFRLERDDGVIDLADADKLAALLTTPNGITGDQTASLRALMVGTKLTDPARDRLGALAVDATTAADVARSTVPRPSVREAARLEQEPLRTYQLTRDEGSYLIDPTKVDAVAPPALARYQDVSIEALDASLTQANAARAVRLTRPLNAAMETPRVCPEDGSVVAHAFHMAMMGPDQTGDLYIRQMAEIGEIEGFNVVARTHVGAAERCRDQYQQEGLDNVEVVGIDTWGDFWSEDQGEIDLEGNLRIPAEIDDVSAAMEAVYRDRIARYYPDDTEARDKPWETLKGQVARKYPLVMFAVPCAVAERATQKVFAAAAVSRGSELRSNLTYLEGGNVLIGTLPDGSGYALVGRDSVATARFALEQDLGRAATEPEVYAAIAEDLGVEPSQVHPVEQPGDFHIDMWMKPIAPGEVILDDAHEAAELYIAWRHEKQEGRRPVEPGPGASPDERAQYERDLAFFNEISADLPEEDQHIREEAKKRAAHEERVRVDLEAAGLTVHRAAGVFIHGWNMFMNFLNAEQALNTRGEGYYVALGGEPWAERYFADKLQEIGAPIERVHFLDRESTQTTLTAHGGISCRSKIEGELALPPV